MKIICPHCKNEIDFYTKDYVYGSIRSYITPNEDDNHADNSAMYDHLNIKQGKILYCGECDRKVCKLKGK